MKNKGNSSTISTKVIERETTRIIHEPNGSDMAINIYMYLTLVFFMDIILPQFLPYTWLHDYDGGLSLIGLYLFCACIILIYLVISNIGLFLLIRAGIVKEGQATHFQQVSNNFNTSLYVVLFLLIPLINAISEGPAIQNLTYQEVHSYKTTDKYVRNLENVNDTTKICYYYDIWDVSSVKKTSKKIDLNYCISKGDFSEDTLSTLNTIIDKKLEELNHHTKK